MPCDLMRDKRISMVSAVSQRQWSSLGASFSGRHVFPPGTYFLPFLDVIGTAHSRRGTCRLPSPSREPTKHRRRLTYRWDGRCYFFLTATRAGLSKSDMTPRITHTSGESPPGSQGVRFGQIVRPAVYPRSTVRLTYA